MSDTPKTDALKEWMKKDALYKAPEQYVECLLHYINILIDECGRYEQELAEKEQNSDNYLFLRNHGAEAAIYVPSNKGTTLVLASGEQLDEAVAEARKKIS